MSDMHDLIPLGVTAQGAWISEHLKRDWSISFSRYDREWYIDLWVPVRTKAGAISKRREQVRVVGPTPERAVWEAARWVAYCISEGLLSGDQPTGGAA